MGGGKRPRFFRRRMRPNVRYLGTGGPRAAPDNAPADGPSSCGAVAGGVWLSLQLFSRLKMTDVRHFEAKPAQLKISPRGALPLYGRHSVFANAAWMRSAVWLSFGLASSVARTLAAVASSSALPIARPASVSL